MTDPRDAGTPLSPLLTMDAHVQAEVERAPLTVLGALIVILKELDAQRATLAAHEQERARLEAELASVRELMNVYNLGGWTDAVAPMTRALKAEAALKAMTDDRDRLKAALADQAGKS